MYKQFVKIFLCVIISFGVLACSAGSDGSISNNAFAADSQANSQGSPVQNPVRRSIGQWAKCDGVTDDRNNFANALSAAKNNAFTLVVDCPLNLRIGMDVAKPLFIESGTTIVFDKKGLITVDNVLVPAFVIANSSNINLQNWSILYTGQTPIDVNTRGYYNNGAWVSASFTAPSTQIFNNITLTNWLNKNRKITYSKRYTFWTGYIDQAALFMIKGDSSNITFNNFGVRNRNNTHFWQYIPIVFSIVPGEPNNSSNSPNNLLNSKYVVVPHNITFNQIFLDGYLFGWHGSGHDLTFSNITGDHYSDFQDSNKQNIGGVGGWFPPPHVFYLNTQPNWDRSLRNYNILINNVVDRGNRLGGVWDYGLYNPLNTNGRAGRGSSTSIKIQGDNSAVANYYSSRTEGLGDVLSSHGLTLTNITAIFDSSFVQYSLPAFRFTESSNTDVTVKNMVLQDNATSTFLFPISGSSSRNNSNIKLQKVMLYMNHWSNDTSLASVERTGQMFGFGGVNNSFDIQSDYTNENSFGGINKYDSTSTYSPLDIDNTLLGSYNNTLRNIPLGSFGLRTYRITNVASYNISGISFPDLKTGFPSGITYDTARTTCKLNGSMSLAIGKSCVITFKYIPNKKMQGIVKFQIKALDHNYRSIASHYVYMPFSTRAN